MIRRLKSSTPLLIATLSTPGCALLSTSVAQAQMNSSPASRPESQAVTSNAGQWPLDQNRFERWAGVTPLKAKGKSPQAVALKSKTEGIYKVPDGPRGWYNHGLVEQNDSSLNLLDWYGLRFEILLEKESPLHLEVTAKAPPRTGRRDIPDSTSTSVEVQGKGWQTVTIPFSSFDYKRGQAGVLRFVQQLILNGNYTTLSQEQAKDARFLLRNVRLVAGNTLHLSSPILSKAANVDGTALYPVTVTNATDVPQVVQLNLERSGWEGMIPTVSPSTLVVPPNGSANATLKVAVPARLPGGAQDTQTLVATPQNGTPEKIEFITLQRVASPFLVFGQEEWDKVRAKAAHYNWAKKELDEVIARAEKFNVPEVAQGKDAISTQGTPGLFGSYIEENLWACAVAWKLTGQRKYGEKAALLLRRFSDPTKGYPITWHAAKGGIPQEGGIFEYGARAYDLLRDSDLLSAQDREHIEATLRLYVQIQTDGLRGNGGISNWTVFNLGPAAQCALVLHDMHSFNELLYGPSGLIDHLRQGTMDDGWWYEMSLSYNLNVANAYTGVGLAARAFGLDLLNARFPVATSPYVGLRPFEYEKFLGMEMHKFGPLRDNWVSIKKMWDGIVIYPDYRGIMFGMGDGHEEKVGGSKFETAYYAYRDPAYAAILKQSDERDLLYGIPDLPADTPKPYTLSGHSDNAGIAVLRSQTPGREPREQIQISHKYGTHGSYHGHFDRLSLNSLERYGRSFYNPETSWYGYGSYMYKWWVQPSMSHNMVVVDGKMQEPVESTPLLFHSGPMMQVSAVENNARWSNPPYFGGYEQLEDVKKGDKPYVQIPDKHPTPGDVTDYSEPIRNRRMLIVTDDYVVIADHLKGSKGHTFDHVLQLRGAALANPQNSKFLGHETQFDVNPVSSGQFITNVNRYGVTAPGLVQSVHRVGEKGDTNWNGDKRNWETGGASSLSEPGAIHIDAHVLWPPQSEVRIGDYAESWNVNKKLTYEVKGDGKTLTSGTFGAWILGAGQVDIDVTNLKSLELNTQVTRGNNTLRTIFWGNAALVTADGKTIPLSQLKTVSENVAPSRGENLDYEGGPIRIAGQPFSQAIAAEPQDAAKAASVSLDLTGLKAVRFKATVGGDWPVGNEEQLRKTVSVRTTGQDAHFLTVVEPYENRSVVKSARATGANTLRVELTDGRIQEITIQNLDSDSPKVSVTITESKNGTMLRAENALSDSSPPPAN